MIQLFSIRMIQPVGFGYKDDNHVLYFFKKRQGGNINLPFEYLRYSDGYCILEHPVEREKKHFGRLEISDKNKYKR